jgi:hypothetical protein
MAMNDDPLYDAERQMIEHEAAAFRELFLKLSARLGLPRRDEETPLPDDDEIRAALERLVEEDPDARDIAERLGVLERFRGGPSHDRKGDE